MMKLCEYIKRSKHDNICSDVKWFVRQYFPITVTLIIFSYIVKSYHDELPKILENYPPITFFLIGVVIVFMVNMCKMNLIVLESKEIEKSNKKKFVLHVVPGFSLDFFADLMSIWIFFISLFYFAFGSTNPYLESLLSIHDYVYGLAVLPLIGYFFRSQKRRTFGRLRVNKDLLFCNKTSKTIIKNYMIISLSCLVLFNLFLIGINL